MSREQSECLSEFEAHLRQDGKAGKTILSYTSDVAMFYAHLANRGQTSAAEFARGDVLSFREWMAGEGYRPATVNKAVNSLSAYC